MFTRKDFYVCLAIACFCVCGWLLEIMPYKVEVKPVNICWHQVELAKTRIRMALMVEHMRVEIMVDAPRKLEPDKRKVGR